MINMVKESEYHLCLPEGGEAYPGTSRQLSQNFRKGAKHRVITCKVEDTVVAEGWSLGVQGPSPPWQPSTGPAGEGLEISLTPQRKRVDYRVAR